MYSREFPVSPTDLRSCSSRRRVALDTDACGFIYCVSARGRSPTHRNSHPSHSPFSFTHPCSPRQITAVVELRRGSKTRNHRLRQRPALDGSRSVNGHQRVAVRSGTYFPSSPGAPTGQSGAIHRRRSPWTPMCTSSVLSVPRSEPSVPAQSPLAVQQIPSTVAAKVEDTNGSSLLLSY